jgi:hypothetical protein
MPSQPPNSTVKSDVPSLQWYPSSAARGPLNAETLIVPEGSALSEKTSEDNSSDADTEGTGE